MGVTPVCHENAHADAIRFHPDRNGQSISAFRNVPHARVPHVAKIDRLVEAICVKRFAHFSFDQWSVSLNSPVRKAEDFPINQFIKRVVDVGLCKTWPSA